jgi:pimeloyl-ACP methyl ester carboxylesterase
VSARTVEGAGVELAYEEHGEGSPLVLVHGTASTRRNWDEVLEALGDGFRTIAYDRRAYGESGQPEDFRRSTVEEHADDLIALLRALDAAPALLCGHSFGAMTSLAVVMREPELVRAAVLLEPPMLWLAPSGAQGSSELRAAIEEGAAERGSAGAIAAFTRVVCGPDALDIVGYERAKTALEHPRGFATDIGAVGDWSVSGSDLRGIDTPVILVAGTRTPPPWREPTEVLARTIPGAELREADSGHLLPNEAPGVVVEAIRELDRRTAAG